MSLLYKDDVGVDLIIATSNTSIPLTTMITLNLEKPGGDTVELAITADMIDYTTGVITYTTVAGDLDEVGEYKIQVHGVFLDADEVSDMDVFNVFEKITV
jgi:hypothetical protein